MVLERRHPVSFRVGSGDVMRKALYVVIAAALLLSCTAQPETPAPGTPTAQPSGTGAPTAPPAQTATATAPPTITHTPTLPTPPTNLPTPTQSAPPYSETPLFVTPLSRRPAFEARVLEGVTLNIREGQGGVVVGQLHGGDYTSCWEVKDVLAGRTTPDGWCEIDPPDSDLWVAVSYLDVTRDYRFEKEVDKFSPNSN